MLAIVTNKQIAKVLTDIFRKKRNTDVWRSGIIVKLDKIRMWHFGAVVCAVTSTDTHIDGGAPIVIPLPLFTVESRLPEDGIYQFGVITCTKSYQGAEGGIGFGVRAVVTDITVFKEPNEFFSILLLAQIVYDMEYYLERPKAK